MREQKAGWVYVLDPHAEIGGQRVYKIRYTTQDVVDRARQLSTGAAAGMTIAYKLWCDDAPTVERRLHKAFAASRITQGRGREFFAHSLERIVEEIEGMAVQVSSHRAAERWTDDMAVFEQREGIATARSIAAILAGVVTVVVGLTTLLLAVAAFKQGWPLLGALAMAGIGLGTRASLLGIRRIGDRYVARRYADKIAGESRRLDGLYPEAVIARHAPMPEHPTLVPRNRF